MLPLCIILVMISVPDPEPTPSPYNCPRPTGSKEPLNVHNVIMEILRKDMCDVTLNFTVKHPDTEMASINIQNLFGYDSTDDDFTFVTNMLYNKGNDYEVMSLDTPWVTTLQDELIELDINPNIIRKKWQLHMSPNGKLYTLTRQTNQMVAYYRKDLFDKHGLTWPATWEEFETTLDTLVEKERAERTKTSVFNGVLLPTDSNSGNEIIYTLVTLMSGFDGAGNIVDDSGNVTVNNPAAARTLEMWKRWVGTIAPHNLWGLKASSAKKQFEEGTAGVLFHWVSSSVGLSKISESKMWDIQMAPVPGNNGSGCSGDWSIGINKYTKNKEAAMDLVNDLSEHFSYFDYSGREPIREDVMQRPDFWANMEKANAMLATSMQAYPEFWERLVHRPSRGCRVLYAECVDIVFRNVRDFFARDGAAEKTVALMEKELEVLLKEVSISGIDYSREEWTDTRIAMVNVSIFSGGMLVGIIFMIVKNASSLHGRSKSFKVPVSVMLGVVALTSFAVVLGVVVTRNDTAIRDISEDLSERWRLQSMLGVEISVHGTVENVVSKSSGSVSVPFLLQRILGVIKQDIARMRVPARSLIVLIDRRTREVLLANDEQQQPVGVEVMGPGDVAEAGETVAHPWVSGALASIENWNTSLIDPERSYLYSSGGEKVYASMLNIQKPASKTYTVDWLVVYITPHVVIMGDAEEAYEEAIDLSVMLAALGVVVLLACAVVITQPFISLVRDMKHVENMEMDRVVKRDSILLEVSALLSGFYAMCDILNEYKAYMPASLFLQETDKEEEQAQPKEQDPEQASKNSNSSRTAASVSSGSMPLAPVTQMKMQATVKTISLVSIWYPGDSVNNVTTILDAVSTVTQGGGRGALLSTSGDQSIIGLNITTHLVSNIMKACQCAMMVRDKLVEEIKEYGIGIGVATGRATVASCGSLALKAFTALGKVMQSVRYLSERSCALQANVLIENPVALVVNATVDVTPVTIFGPEFRRLGSEQVIFHVGNYLETENEEWMYAYARNCTESNSVVALMADLSHTNEVGNKKIVADIEAAWLAQGIAMPDFLSVALQDLRNRFGK